MFAPALVGAVMPLSVAAFETCRSQLLNPAGSAVEGRPIPLLAAEPEEAPWRRADTSHNIRGPIGRPKSAVPSRSVDQLGPREWGAGCLGLRIQAARSPRSCPWRDASRPRGWCTTSQTMLPPANDLRGSAVRRDWKPAQGVPEFSR
jgi:hypothetical protein